MRIFLDSRDLIPLLDRSEPCNIDELGKWLRVGGHSIALSLTVAFEMAPPLIWRASTALATTRFNLLERLPLIYLADGFIPQMELQAAVDARNSGGEYEAVDPTVPRLDRALEVNGPHINRLFLNYPLAELMFDLAMAAPSVLGESTSRESRLHTMLAADRSNPSPPSPSSHFKAKVARDLRLHRVGAPKCGIDAFADWVYRSPSRCPGLRLSFEVFNRIRENRADRGQLQDFEDLAHVGVIPYVDVATLDKRMADYVRRATRGLGVAWAEKVRPSLSALLEETTHAV